MFNSPAHLPEPYDRLHAQLRMIFPDNRLITDRLRTLAYGTDASCYRLVPKIVAVVESECEVERLMACARDLEIPVTFRAAGTSLSGQAITDSVLVLLGENWDGCIVKPEQECADPKPSSWTHSEVHTVVTSEFANRGGPAVDYLKSRIFPGPIMNGMLVWMGEEQAGGADAAIEFLIQHEDLWTKWVSADAAAKIKASL